MTATMSEIESLSLKVNQEIRVRASLETTFAALLEELGPSSQLSDGTPMAMVRIEKANAEYGQLAGELLNCSNRDAGFLGRARPG